MPALRAPLLQTAEDQPPGQSLAAETPAHEHPLDLCHAGLDLAQGAAAGRLPGDGEDIEAQARVAVLARMEAVDGAARIPLDYVRIELGHEPPCQRRVGWKPGRVRHGRGGCRRSHGKIPSWA